MPAKFGELKKRTAQQTSFAAAGAGGLIEVWTSLHKH